MVGRKPDKLFRNFNKRQILEEDIRLLRIPSMYKNSIL